MRKNQNFDFIVEEIAVDIIVIDKDGRLKRPYLIIDEYSQWPIACIFRELEDKRPCLEESYVLNSKFGEDAFNEVWPIHSLPKRIYCDNEADFFSTEIET